MKIIFKNRRKLWNLHKIFKIFRRAISHEKSWKNILTMVFFCAKIGIVKVFFINIGNDFHNFHKIARKSTKKWKLFSKRQKTRKEAKSFEQDFTTGAALVQRHGQVWEESCWLVILPLGRDPAIFHFWSCLHVWKQWGNDSPILQETRLLGISGS